MSLGFGLYNDNGIPSRKELTASDWMTQCIPIMMDNFRYHSYDVEFEGSNTSRVLSLFLLDELEQLRKQTAADEVASEEECLLVIERAAARFSEVCYFRRPTTNTPDTVVRVKVRDEAIPSVLGGYSIGQWETHLRTRDDVHDIAWTGYMNRSSIRSMYDGYAEYISEGLMLYLYGYTCKDYTNNGVDYYKDLNPDMDKTAMRTKQLELMDYIAAHLPRFPEREKMEGDKYVYSVGIVPYLLYQSVIDMMPDIVSDVLGMEYGDFLSSGAFVNAPYDGGLLRARYNEHSENVVLGAPRSIDRNNLNDLLTSIVFEEGDVAFSQTAEISFYYQVFSLKTLDMLYFPLPVLTAGRGADGNYYLQSGRYFAKLTRKQFSTFLDICCLGEVDNQPYAYERHDLLEGKK